MHPNNLINLANETFDTYWEKASHQTPEPVLESVEMESLASFLLNESMALSNDMVDDLIDNGGFFGCINNPQQPCLGSIQFLQTIPRKDIQVPDAAVNP